MDARGYDIEKRISKEAYNFRMKRYDEPEYVMLDNDTYDELKEHCKSTYIKIDKTLEPMPDITQYMGMTVVRTYTAGRGIAVGRHARP